MSYIGASAGDDAGVNNGYSTIEGGGTGNAEDDLYPHREPNEQSGLYPSLQGKSYTDEETGNGTSNESQRLVPPGDYPSAQMSNGFIWRGDDKEDHEEGQESGKISEPAVNSENGSTEGEEPAARRSISAFRLAMMAYFFTCGGPFGIEPAVSAAGPLFTLISFVVVPWLWSVPQAVLSAELALMMEQNGGNIIWVRRAFGTFWGWINAYNFIISSLASLSLYPILFVDYLPWDVGDDITWWQAVLIKLGFVLILTFINVLGISWISRLSFVFLIFIISPFIVETIAAPILVDMQFMKLFTPVAFNKIHWGLFLSTVLWSYGGYDSMGSVAGEVKGGRGTYIMGIATSLPLCIFNYFLPVAVGYAISPKMEDWQSGYFTNVAYNVATWLGIWMVAASVVTNFGTYNVTMASCARVIWACGRGPVETKLMPSFVSLSRRSKKGTVRPIAAILLVGGITFALSLLTYNTLVQLTMTVRIINLWLEYGSLVMLKFTEPDTPRPFVVPGGKIGAALISVPTILLSLALLAGCDWEVWVITGGVNVVILLLFGFRCVLLSLFSCMEERKKKKKPSTNDASVN